jgi:hypothetical protein
MSPAPATTVIEDDGSASLFSDLGSIVTRMSVDNDYLNPIGRIVQIEKG